MATVLSDPLFADLADPEKYHVERGVPVFKPHTRYEIVDGKLSTKVKYRVSNEELQEICNNSNAALRDFYHYPRHTVGHVIPGLTDETLQPAKLLGVASNFRVANYSNGDPVIVADLHTKSDRWSVAQEYPYRSAEYNWKTKKIRGVARLLQDPALELGTYQYANDDTVVYAEAVMADGNDNKLKGRPNPNDKPGKKDAASPKDGAADQNASHDDPIKTVFGDLNPDEVVAAERLARFFEAKYPQLAPLLKNKSGEIPDQKPPPADVDDPAEPEEQENPDSPGHGPDTNGKQDKGQGPQGSKPSGKPKDDEADSMSQNADPNKTVENLQAQIAEMQLDAALDHAAHVEHYQFDRASIRDTLLAIPADKRVAIFASLKKSMSKSPTAVPPVEVLQEAIEISGTDRDPITIAPTKMTVEQYADASLDFVGTEVKPGQAPEQVWAQLVRKHSTKAGK
jgi:hypothetical protein